MFERFSVRHFSGGFFYIGSLGEWEISRFVSLVGGSLNLLVVHDRG